jgi:hypothetical protein
MHEILDNLDKANRLFKMADHLTYVSYPLLKDNKLIITILENLNEANNRLIDSLLYYDYYFKRIKYVPKDDIEKREIFKLYSINRYNLNKEYIVLIKNLNEIIEKRKSSKMEFVKNDKYVIWNENNLLTLNYEKIKEYINKLKPFFNQINIILKDVRR